MRHELGRAHCLALVHDLTGSTTEVLHWLVCGQKDLLQVRYPVQDDVNCQAMPSHLVPGGCHTRGSCPARSRPVFHSDRGARTSIEPRFLTARDVGRDPPRVGGFKVDIFRCPIPRTLTERPLFCDSTGSIEGWYRMCSERGLSPVDDSVACIVTR